MYKLPHLPYSYNALEPYIDEKTMNIHHQKHHASYVDNLNKVLVDHKKLSEKPLEKLLTETDNIPQNIRQTVINNAGGHANHSLFWTIMGPPPASRSSPEGILKESLDKYFGSFDKFKDVFSKKAMTVFGSGWAFLMVTPNGSLEVKRHSFQNSPLMNGNTPILGVDVWEHAYYLKYQNRRSDYIDNWWKVVNWQKVAEFYQRASS